MCVLYEIFFVTKSPYLTKVKQKHKVGAETIFWEEWTEEECFIENEGSKICGMYEYVKCKHI
jgi:hypothetical protein